MVRTPEQMDETLKALREEWQKYPELRLGQLLINVTTIDGYRGSCLFNIRDEHLVDAVQKFQPRRMPKDSVP